MKTSRLKLGAVALACVAVGVGAGAIANGAASTSAPATTHSAHRARLGLRALVRRTAQANLVVHTKQGFVNVTVARGTVQSVSGNEVTLAEGTRKATYKTVTYTLPAAVRVRDNRQRSTLSAVKPGQRALVVMLPKRALVIARTPKTP
ncbi:MAG TPA: hypothetical protein VG410_12095 [Solirubrobacteraceae bacterium]|jgi:hypothetical protein|nr:hypothetical protein [Solirubrobacteraceae bacterium]